jgi:hypothetical protein
VGAFHSYPVGVEASIFAPILLGNPTTKPLVLTTAALRITAYRGAIGAEWTERRKPPPLAYVLGARLGGGFLWGLETPATFLGGLTAELVVDGWLLVGLRPTLAFAHVPAARAGESSFPYDVFPMLDLSLGSLAPGVYEEPAEAAPQPIIAPPEAKPADEKPPEKKPAEEPKPAEPKPAEPKPAEPKPTDTGGTQPTAP